MMLSHTLAVLVGVVAVVASASAYTPYQHEPLPLQFVESMAIMHPDSSLANTTVCWKGTHDRGVGTIPNSCTPGHVRNGALCYPDCKAGYNGVGPVCWQICPKGWVDEGALCRKDGSITTIAKKSYGPGAGDGGALCCASKGDCTSKILGLCDCTSKIL